MRNILIAHFSYCRMEGATICQDQSEIYKRASSLNGQLGPVQNSFVVQVEITTDKCPVYNLAIESGSVKNWGSTELGPGPLLTLSGAGTQTNLFTLLPASPQLYPLT